MSTARVYRFCDMVAASLDGERYLRPAEARKLADTLNQFADDIQDRPFQKSQLNTVEFELEDKR